MSLRGQSTPALLNPFFLDAVISGASEIREEGSQTLAARLSFLRGHFGKVKVEGQGFESKRKQWLINIRWSLGGVCLGTGHYLPKERSHISKR